MLGLKTKSWPSGWSSRISLAVIDGSASDDPTWSRRRERPNRAGRAENVGVDQCAGDAGSGVDQVELGDGLLLGRELGGAVVADVEEAGRAEGDARQFPERSEPEPLGLRAKKARAKLPAAPIAARSGRAGM